SGAGSVINRFGCFNRFIYRREWSFRIYRETLSRFRAPLHCQLAAGQPRVPGLAHTPKLPVSRCAAMAW
ncbi:hypothetical protein ABLN67_06880, partial [Mycobacterium tuberculosis]